jgi:hydroxymethylpyrimidine pyrophosphatase-like HAD family hydrolase
MGKKYLIVLDVDGTLVDSEYRATSPTIYSVIDQMQKEGHLFVLNSNRSMEDIMRVANHFGITGYVIGENGCFISSIETGDQTILESQKTIDEIDTLKKNIPEIISQNFQQAKFIISDTTDFNKHLDTQDRPDSIEKYFIMNEYRKYSLSIHVRKIAEDQIAKDAQTTKIFYNLIKDYIEKNELKLLAQYTETYSNVLVCSCENNKTTAFKILTEKLPKNFTKVIIADDLIDKPALNEINYFFVVNNAADSVKAVAHYVSHESITKGVEDILLKIDSLTK